MFFLWGDGMNKLIRRIALNLAIFQLFAGATGAKSEESEPIRSRYVLVQDDEEIPIYQKLDYDTGEARTISIFEPENIYFKQYGASQQDFRDRFRELIEEPVIWDEMQKYYPVEKFDDYDEALFFYKLYFDIIYDCGCGYSVATNFIFRIYEGREKDFYKDFGFPMYVIKNNVLDFNYEPVMLKLFNYNNLKVRKRYRDIAKQTEKAMLYYKVKTFNSKNIIPVPNREIATEEDWQEWFRKGREKENKLKELEKKATSAETVDIYFGVEATEAFGNIIGFLADRGVKITTDLEYTLGKPNVDEIIASDKFTLYHTNDHGNVFNSDKIDLHYVYITDIKDDGTIIVSSWGEMFIFDGTNAEGTKKIILKMSR